MLVRRIARPLLGSYFIAAGLNGWREAAAPATEPVVAGARNMLPQHVTRYLPDDPQVYARANKALQLIGGLALASGKLPRISALVLAGTLVPTTLAENQFWQESDPAARAQQRAHFWKNTSILGGLIIAGIDTEGRPGLSWRARRATRHAAAVVASVVPTTNDPVPSLTDKINEFGDVTRSLAERAGERWDEVSETIGEGASTLSEIARHKAPILADYARDKGNQLAKVAQEQGSTLADAASQRGRKIADHAAHLRSELKDAAARS